MSIDTVFILSAGLGTRMGEIGKVLPKPMWPFFNQTLFSATVEFWKSKGFKKFYANVHHGADMMIKHMEELGVTPLYEKELLGSGGAFHNLKSQYPNLGMVLSVNCDNFPLSFNGGEFEKHLNTDVMALFSMPVKRGEKFNRLKIQSGELKDIEKIFEDDGVTYSGAGLIDLDSIDLEVKNSSFFDSVANYKEKSIQVIDDIFDNFIDFGTIENYFKSKFDLIKNSDASSLIKSCKVETAPYIQGSNIIYSGCGIKETENSIIIDSNLDLEHINKSIVYKDIIEKI